MTKKIYIKGMESEHCAKRVESILKSLDDICSVKVDLKEKIATVELHKDVKDEDFVRAIDDGGYEVVKIE